MDGEAPELPAAQQHVSHRRVRRLLLATDEGDVKTATRLVTSHPNIAKHHDAHGQTPLMWAAYRGSQEVVRLLLAHGAELDSTDKDGRTALFIACDWSRTAVVGMLLDKGADPSICSKIGETPLMAASWSGDLESVVRLLGMGAIDVDSCDEEGSTALWEACRCDWPDIVAVLLRAGADRHSAGVDGRVPRDVALEAEHVECVRRLDEAHRAYLLLRARRLQQWTAVALGDPSAFIAGTPRWMSGRAMPDELPRLARPQDQGTTPSSSSSSSSRSLLRTFLGCWSLPAATNPEASPSAIRRAVVEHAAAGLTYDVFLELEALLF